jgi:hypothetical protein
MIWHIHLGSQVASWHALDDLDGKIQAIQSLPEKEPGSKWTRFIAPTGEVFSEAVQVTATGIPNPWRNEDSGGLTT